MTTEKAIYKRLDALRKGIDGYLVDEHSEADAAEYLIEIYKIADMIKKDAERIGITLGELPIARSLPSLADSQLSKN